VIHFDTNALVMLPYWAREGHAAITRVVEGEAAAVCAVVWYEFLMGPVDEAEIRLARAFVQGRIVPVEESDAVLAAQLFNAAGRRRTLRTDGLIAACAIRAQAELVTLNVADFESFIPHGVRLLGGTGQRTGPRE
jgi:predicted nucleic acid-binding protein